MKDQVDILLATYQGEAYLHEQLHSLMQQSYPYFHIFIRDDGSADQTLSIAEAFIKAYPDRLSIIPSSQRLGVKGNFSELMGHARAPYIMFCDQDDIWLPYKIEASLRQIKELENQCKISMPLLVHTDLQVVQSDLTLIDSSFWSYSHLDPSLTSLNRLLVQNIVTGCTMMINQSLLRLAYPIPSRSVMHDWWLALVASLFGKIVAIEEATLLYRQHGSNDVGAQKFNWWQFIENRISRKAQTANFGKYEQAQQLLERYSPLLSTSQQEMIKAFCSLQYLSYFKRMKCNWHYQFMPHFFPK